MISDSQTCSRCGHEAHNAEEVERDFGYRTDRGRRYNNPQCRPCRKIKRRKDVWDIAPTLTFGVEVEWTHGASRSAACAGAVKALRDAGYTVDYYHGDTSFRVATEPGVPGSRRVTIKFVYDASVSGGGEMVTGIMFYNELECVQTIVRGMRAASCKTRRASAGVHVHVGAQDLTIGQIRNLCRYVNAWEDHIKAAVNTNRNRRGWARDIKSDFVTALEAKGGDWSRGDLDKAWYDNTGHGHTGKRAKYHGSRYHGLNLHALFTKGTVEFRYFDGTLHAGRIRAYVELCLALVARSAAAKQATSKRRELADASFGTREERVQKSMGEFFTFCELTARRFKTTRHHLTNNARNRIGLPSVSWASGGA